MKLTRLDIQSAYSGGSMIFKIFICVPLLFVLLFQVGHRANLKKGDLKFYVSEPSGLFGLYYRIYGKMIYDHRFAWRREKLLKKFKSQNGEDFDNWLLIRFKRY